MFALVRANTTVGYLILLLLLVYSLENALWIVMWFLWLIDRRCKELLVLQAHWESI